MKKKLTAMFLSLLLLCAFGVQAAAADEAAEQTPALPDGTLYYGEILAVNKDADRKVTSVKMDSERYGEVLMLVDEQTVYIDAGRKTAADATAQLVVGQSLYVYHSAAATMSIPPQTYAYAFVNNVPADAACPHYHVAESVTQNDDGSVTVTTDNGGLQLSVSADASVSPYRTKQAMSLADLRAGVRFMAWYDVALTSYPGQAGTNSVMILPARSGDTVEGTITAGETTLTECFRVENDVTMVPVRAVAEALGLEVGFERTGDVRNITVSTDSFAVHMTAGVDNIYGATTIPDAVGMTAPQHYDVAPYIEDPGVTWAPADLFTMLGFTVTAENGMLTISA